MGIEASKDLLRRLALAPGAPGAEDAVRKILQEELGEAGSLSYDRLGSILCERGGSSATPRVVLDAHMDEVGFMVQSITDEGRLRFVPLGGWWGHVLLGQRVDILTGDELIAGVIGSKPPHFLQASEREKVMSIDDMYIDIGVSSREQAAELGVRVGDPVVPHSDFIEMNSRDVLSCKAFDDRAGVGVLCEVMKSLASIDHPNTVIGVGAVQEEVGCRGAETASELASPDAAVVLEGTPADDLPGFSDRQAVLGNGPQLRLFDPTAIANRRFVRWVEDLAAKEEIEIQLAVRKGGGTDARSIHRYGAGVPVVVIGVPARYIHTHVSLIHWHDYRKACELVQAIVGQLNGEVVASFVDFGSD